jgi:hypothetical protein
MFQSLSARAAICSFAVGVLSLTAEYAEAEGGSSAPPVLPLTPKRAKQKG